MAAAPASPEVRTIVSANWLADHAADPKLVIVDATVTSTPRPGGGASWVSGIEHYRQAHIPGAVFADIVHDFSTPHAKLHFTKPNAARFEEAARVLGVDPDSTVVVYDTGNGAFAARLWWLFRAFGHDRVAVLDGGIAAWRASGGSTDEGEQAHEQGTFVARTGDGLFVSKDEVAAAVADGGAAIVSALPPESPADAGFRGRAGRIPGTVTVPAASLIGADGRLLPVTELTRAFDGVALDGPVITYCGGGIAASLDSLALTHLGAREVRLYDGSLNEWALDPDAPLVSELS